MNKMKMLKEIWGMGTNEFSIQSDGYTFSFDLNFDDPDESNYVIISVNNDKWLDSCCLEVAPFCGDIYLFDRYYAIPSSIFKKVTKSFRSRKLWGQIKEIYKKCINENFNVKKE